MAQTPTDAPVSYTAEQHAIFHNQMAAITNQLDNEAASEGDVLILDTGQWVPKQPGDAGLAEVGHTHPLSEITSLPAAKVVTGTYTVLNTDSVLIANAASAVTINLPAVSGFGNQSLLVVRYGASSVTINRNGSDVIWTAGATANSVPLTVNGARWSGVAVSSLSRWISIS